MRLIVHRDWPKVPDGSKECATGIIPEGEHEVEVIDPTTIVGASARDKQLFREGDLDYRWLVLANREDGALIGASIHFWKLWANPGLGVHCVEIIEDHKKLP